MKRAWIVVAVLSFLPVTAGFAQAPAPSVAPLSAEALAAILGQPTDSGCPEPEESVVLRWQRRLLHLPEPELRRRHPRAGQLSGRRHPMSCVSLQRYPEMLPV
jgi:hypothetical protein